MTVGGPKVVPTGSNKMPRTESTAFTVQEDLAELLASSRKDLYQSGNWLNTMDILYNGTSDSASLGVPLFQLH